MGWCGTGEVPDLPLPVQFRSAPVNHSKGGYMADKARARDFNKSDFRSLGRSDIRDMFWGCVTVVFYITVIGLTGYAIFIILH